VEERRELAKYVMDERGLSERQACRTVNLHRCTYRYQAKKTDDHEIVQELHQLAESQPRWGCRKMTDYLRNQGHRWNHKRIRRVYCDLALNLHRKPKQRLAARTALALGVPVRSNLTWSLDFMSDSLSNGRAIRTLNILDDYNREALWIEVDTSLPAERVVRVLENLLLWRAAPKQIRMDNGPELISQRLGNWAKAKQIELIHIQPGKPAQNAYIERFNRTFREDVLDAYLFDSLNEVRTITEHWLEEYNTIRPHEALQGLSPRQFTIQNT
jgi:putative transposase